jgi:cytochrome c
LAANQAPFCGLLPTRLVLFLLAAISALVAQSPKYGVGRTPTTEEIQAREVSVAPDGAGLPPGSGSAIQGKDVYASKCARCHGGHGQGGDEAALVGGQGSLNTPKPLKTVGSYWPYATTLFDYVRRAMPFKQPGTLTANQVYAVSAYILHLNGIIREDTVLDAKTLPQVTMPNRKGFVPDPRPDTSVRTRK